MSFSIAYVILNLLNADGKTFSILSLIKSICNLSED